MKKKTVKYYFKNKLTNQNKTYKNINKVKIKTYIQPIFTQSPFLIIKKQFSNIKMNSALKIVLEI